MKLIQIKIFFGLLLLNIICFNKNQITNLENKLIKQELNDNKKKSILLPSKKNIEFNPENKYILYNNNKYFGKENKYTFKDSLNDKTTLKFFMENDSYSIHNDYNINVYFYYNTNEYINEFLEKHKTDSDSLFMKIFSHSEYYGFNNAYYYNINEKYYLYFKKYYGNVDFYQYNGELNSSTDTSQFKKPIISYQDSNQYHLINNKLITVHGYQFFSFYNTYNSLYQTYLQKYDDSADIQVEDLSQFKNFVKLLQKDKTYNFNFNVNHLIRLDDNFIDSEVKLIDENGKEYDLNKFNKIIKIKADKVSVRASKENAFIYCYSNYSEFRSDSFKIIEFDKSKSGKIMKFIIENKNEDEDNSRITIIKDFGFEGYFPILYRTNFDQILPRKKDHGKTNTIYVENLYDKLSENLFEDRDYKEKFFIYVFEHYDEEGIPFYNNQNLIFGEPVYIDNLMTKGNKYNFEIIPGNSNGGIILNSLSKERVDYQFFTCKNNKIKFEISSSNGYFKDEIINSPYEVEINKNKEITMSVSKNDILMHTFESENEFLFIYSFKDENDERDPLIYTDLDIDIGYKDTFKNILIKFTPIYKYTLTKYFIVIGPKDETITEDNFSNPCFLANLIIKNPKDIKIINILDLGENNSITEEVDISDILSNEFLINIVSQELKNEKLNFYNPKIYKIKSDKKDADDNDDDEEENNGEKEEEKEEEDEEEEKKGEGEKEGEEGQNKNKGKKNGNDEEDDDDDDYKGFYIGLGCVFGSLILIILVVVIIFFIRKKSQEKLLAAVNQISFAEDREPNDEYQTSILD